MFSFISAFKMRFGSHGDLNAIFSRAFYKAKTDTMDSVLIVMRNLPYFGYLLCHHCSGTEDREKPGHS